MKPINVYNLGEEGVNVDVDDVHLRDGELRTAQNWQIDPAGGIGGIRRRDGMTALNATPLAGSVTGIIALPLPDRSQLTRNFYAAIDDAGSNFFSRSTDGTTWANSTHGSVPQEEADLGAFGALIYGGTQRWLGFRNKLWYPGSDYVAGTDEPTIHVWDGTTDYKFADLPSNPNQTIVSVGILSIIPYDETHLLISTHDGATPAAAGRVIMMDVGSGAMTTIGPETNLPGPPMNMVVWQGKIWTGLINTSGGATTTVRWARPSDATWTTDLTTGTANGYVIDLAVFQGNLYVGLAADSGSNALIRKRTSDGVWSTVLTSDGTGANNYLGPFITMDDDTKIFAYWASVSGGAAPINRIVESSDGSTWSTSHDIAGTYASGTSFTQSGMPVRDSNGDIYWPIMVSAGSIDRILKRTDAGTWSSPGSSLNLRGPIGIINF